MAPLFCVFRREDSLKPWSSLFEKVSVPHIVVSLLFDFAGKRDARCVPLRLIGGLVRTKVDPLCPKFSSAARVSYATKNVHLPGDLNVNEARSHNRGLQFCF